MKHDLGYIFRLLDQVAQPFREILRRDVLCTLDIATHEIVIPDVNDEVVRARFVPIVLDDLCEFLPKVVYKQKTSEVECRPHFAGDVLHSYGAAASTSLLVRMKHAQMGGTRTRISE